MVLTLWTTLRLGRTSVRQNAKPQRAEEGYRVTLSSGMTEGHPVASLLTKDRSTRS